MNKDKRDHLFMALIFALVICIIGFWLVTQCDFDRIERSKYQNYIEPSGNRNKSTDTVNLK